MKIAILSWGSLIKSGVSRGLEITSAGWSEGGPRLPIEFSRVSQSGNRAGCLTLVIDEQNGTFVPTQYAISSMIHLDWALLNLRFVESISLIYSVGYVNLIKNTERGWARQHHPLSCNIIKEWASENGIDAVIWTSLLSNFENVLCIPFTTENAVNYVRNLPESVKIKALEYINESPEEIITPVRSGLLNNSTVREFELVGENPGDRTLRRFLERFMTR